MSQFAQQKVRIPSQKGPISPSFPALLITYTWIQYFKKRKLVSFLGRDIQHIYRHSASLGPMTTLCSLIPILQKWHLACHRCNVSMCQSISKLLLCGEELTAQLSVHSPSTKGSAAEVTACAVTSDVAVMMPRSTAVINSLSTVKKCYFCPFVFFCCVTIWKRMQRLERD